MQGYIYILRNHKSIGQRTGWFYARVFSPCHLEMYDLDHVDGTSTVPADRSFCVW